VIKHLDATRFMKSSIFYFPGNLWFGLSLKHYIRQQHRRWNRNGYKFFCYWIHHIYSNTRQTPEIV